MNLRLGVVGYCPPTRFDEDKALEYLVDGYNRVSADFPGRHITVVSGLTNVGVLRLAYEEAVRRGWKTAGVASEKAMSFPWFPTDEAPIVVGSGWGDESDIFIYGNRWRGHPHEHGLDAIVRIGIGEQSIRECDAMKAMGKKAYGYDLPPLD